jgi:hypothetical protein
MFSGFEKCPEGSNAPPAQPPFFFFLKKKKKKKPSVDFPQIPWLPTPATHKGHQHYWQKISEDRDYVSVFV